MNQLVNNETLKEKNDAPKVLFTLAGGGYLWEARQLVNKLKAPINYLYVTPSDSMAPTFSEIPEGEVFYISRVTTLSEKSRFKKGVNFIKSLIQSFRLLKGQKPDVVICIGVSISVPLCLCGKLLGIKTVFIESLARVNSLSKTGKIIHRFKLADYIYVQWPELVDERSGILYNGTLI